MNKIKLMMVHTVLKNGRKKSRKKSPWKGTQFLVPVADNRNTEVFLYEPKEKKWNPMPVMFNLHGGAWVGGDATAIDDESQQMADTLHAYVVNINYTKVDEKPFPYCQQEVRDVVLYFAEHADAYGIDTTRFNLIGYSAGGHICAGSAILLKEAGFQLCSNIPTYPFLDFHSFETGGFLHLDAKTVRLMQDVFFRGGVDPYSAVMSPASATIDDLKGLSPTELILCAPDDIYQQGFDYRDRLLEAGAECELKVVDKSLHGFMEGEYDHVISESDIEQGKLKDETMLYLRNRMWTRWGYESALNE